MNAADAKAVTEKLGRGFGGSRSAGATSPLIHPMAPPCLGRRKTASTACSSTRLGRRSPTSTWVATASTPTWRRAASTCLALPPRPPSEEGRPAPVHAQERWLADKCQYAPWHYKREAMLTSPSRELCIPPTFIKEQLHEIPLDYAWVEGVSDKSRHRLLGNGWHVAARLLAVLSWRPSLPGAGPGAPFLGAGAVAPRCGQNTQPG